MDTLWEYVRFLYKKHHNIPPRVVDYMAVHELLILCSEGKSNARISAELGLDLKYVITILLEFGDTAGWDSDLDINPLQVYNGVDGHFETFVELVSTSKSLRTRSQLYKAFTVCRHCELMRKEINKYVK